MYLLFSSVDVRSPTASTPCRPVRILGRLPPSLLELGSYAWEVRVPPFLPL